MTPSSNKKQSNNKQSNNKLSFPKPSSDEPSGSMLPRWLVPAVLAVALGFGATVAPAPVQAQDSLTRVLVDIADVVFRGSTPYYRGGYRDGDYRNDDRLIVGHDRYGRTVYYRVVPRDQRDYRRSQVRYRNGPQYGNGYGHYRNRDDKHRGHDDRDDEHDDRRWRHDDHGDDDDDDD